jgi:hypothetical protein
LTIYTYCFILIGEREVAMPNWCEGNLKIEGESTKLKELVNFLNSPYERTYTNPIDKTQETQKFSNPVFAFWNVLKPEPEEMERYITTEYWWDWNIKNWGTKWDIANVDGENFYATHCNSEELENGFVYYNFSTAWSPCSPVVSLLTQKFPTLRFTYTYVEPGMVFWGIESYTDGELVSEVGGETLSHKAYELMGDVDSCNCSWNEDEEYLYKDCPKNVSVA